jgi:3-dehydroshikimate dehydratase
MNDVFPIIPGLCSVTFRTLDVAAVSELAAECGLQAIELGGDVHVPVGDIVAAEAARRACADHGVAIASYGSYLTAGRISDAAEVRSVLDTALALGAPNVRVWARDSDTTATDLTAICADATDRDLTISLEFHPGTSTETAASTNSLLNAVAADNLFTYWQPNPVLSPEEALSELDAVLPRVTHLHVFSWQPDHVRLPLHDGSQLWPEALRRATATHSPIGSRIAFLEFVHDDDPAQLRADAATLHHWLAATTEPSTSLGGRVTADPPRSSD